MMDAKELRLDLAQHYCSDQIHYNPMLRGIALSDGIVYLRDNAECQWLINEIWLAQQTVKARSAMCRDIQFWTLTVREDHTATLLCEADKGQPVYTKEIPLTDFPLIGETKIWLEFGGWRYEGRDMQGMVAMLPSER